MTRTEAKQIGYEFFLSCGLSIEFDIDEAIADQQYTEQETELIKFYYDRAADRVIDLLRTGLYPKEKAAKS